MLWWTVQRLCSLSTAGIQLVTCVFPTSADHLNDMFAACRYVAQHAFIITSYRLLHLCLPAHMNPINCMYAESAWRIQTKLKILVLFISDLSHSYTIEI